MSDNKTIAKNTVFLYTRMLINMFVTLYTSRVVLNILGVSDYGIYNLVAGVIAMFSFLNNSMSSATQRFINFEKANNEIDKIRLVFNLSLKNHFYISLILVILCETFGLWFLNNKLNIPDNRMFAANIVFQVAILSTFFDINRIPFGAMIIAFEKMSFYAFLGVVETINKILIIVALSFVKNVDYLILYSFLYFISGFITNMLFFLFCKINFKEYVRLERVKDPNKNKELLSFSSWLIFSQIAAISASQGLSMLLNVFYGVIINAAIGIATQVNNAVYGFVSNFQVAFQPQIVQTYASKQYERNKDLILNTSRFSMYLIALLSVPIIFFTQDILRIWLGEIVPDHASKLIIIVIFCSLIDAIAGPFWMAATAIGKVKTYYLILSFISFCTLPVAFLLLHLGYSPVIAFSTRALMYVISLIYRYIFVQKHLSFNRSQLTRYFFNVAVVFLFIGIAIIFGNRFQTQSLIQLFIGIVLVEFLLIIVIILFGTSQKERLIGLNFLKNKLKLK